MLAKNDGSGAVFWDHPGFLPHFCDTLGRVSLWDVGVSLKRSFPTSVIPFKKGLALGCPWCVIEVVISLLLREGGRVAELDLWGSLSGRCWVDVIGVAFAAYL